MYRTASHNANPEPFNSVGWQNALSVELLCSAVFRRHAAFKKLEGAFAKRKWGVKVQRARREAEAEQRRRHDQLAQRGQSATVHGAALDGHLMCRQTN